MAETNLERHKIHAGRGRETAMFNIMQASKRLPTGINQNLQGTQIEVVKSIKSTGLRSIISTSKRWY